MSRNNNKKLIFIIAMISVLTVSIGFAVMSQSLMIKSHLSVNPGTTSGEYSILFSSSSIELKIEEIKPSKNPETIEASNYYSNLYSEGYYKWERGTIVYSERPTEWVGKIGLMYPSDYGYATDFTMCSETLNEYNSTVDSYACRINDWLFNSSDQWVITPVSSPSVYGATNVFSVGSTGWAGNLSVSNYNNGVRPVLYLKSNVSIVGTETTSDGISYYVVD